MDITQLRYFLTTAETLNYTQAAQQLYISRQALRQALSGMEKELGMPLFVNRRNKLSLTAAGEYLRLSGAEVVKSFDEMKDGLQRFAEQKTVLPVAFSHSLFPFMVPEFDGLLRRFQSRYPMIGLDVRMMSNDQVIEALMAGDLACGGVIQMPCQRSGLHMEALVCYDAIVSYGENHPFSGRRYVREEDLAGLSFIGMGGLRETMRPLWEACRKKGVEFQYETVPDTIDAFYRIAHEPVAGFDILKEKVPDFSWSRCSLLEGYSWEIGLLCREDSPLHREVQLFCCFMGEEYERMKAEQCQTGLSPLSSF